MWMQNLNQALKKDIFSRVYFVWLYVSLHMCVLIQCSWHLFPQRLMRNAKKKKKLLECENNISWKDTAPCLKGFDVEYQVWWVLKDGLITEDGWRMCWSRLPLLVGEGSHLIYLQLPGDSVSIRAGWQHSTMQRRESGRRGGEREGPGIAVPFHRERAGWRLSLWHTQTQTHSVTHCPRYQWSVQHTHTSCVHTRLSLWSSAAIQRCSAILLRRVINYSSRISALVRSWAW